MKVLQPPGGYGDGPVYVRVERAEAEGAWPRPGYDKVINDRSLSDDPAHDYIRVENSHNAFIVCRWLREDGVSARALAVVRIERDSASSAAYCW